MKLLDIKLDTELQSRVEISDEAINDYSEALREGAKFPPVTVIRMTKKQHQQNPKPGTKKLIVKHRDAYHVIIERSAVKRQ